MSIQRIREFLQDLPAFRRGQVRNHREALELYANTVHKHAVSVDWEHPHGQPVAAEINEGRWIVRCPYCNGATMAQEGEVFWCPDCLMLENGGAPRVVLFPPAGAVQEIERLLLKRPQEARHWRTYETLEHLERENEFYLKGSSR